MQSFKVVKDLNVNSIRTNTSITYNSQVIPFPENPVQTTGSIYFDPNTNLFYGSGNTAPSPLGSRVIGTINTGVTPAGLAILPNGSKAYVANNNNYGIAGSDSVTVIDLTTLLPSKLITDVSFNQPYTITINPAGTIAYVTNSAGTSITLINTTTDMVSDVITGFDGPSGMTIYSPPNLPQIGYINNYGSSGGVGSGNGNTVSVVNLQSNTITNTITVGQAPAAITISPDQTKVYTANYITGAPGVGTLSVINTSNNSCTVDALSGFSGPFSIVITPDGTKAFVSNFGSNNFAPYGTSVSVVTLNPLAITKTIPVGIQPSGLAITPDGSKAFVSNYNTLYAGATFSNLTAGQGTVNVIDIVSLEVVPPTITVGNSPANIAISPDGSKAFVSNFLSNTVTAFTC